MPFDRRAGIAAVALIVALLACNVGFRLVVKELNAYLTKKPVQLRAQLSTIPKRLGNGWQTLGDDQVLTATIVEALGTDRYLNRVYVKHDPGEPAIPVVLHIAYYTGMIDAVPHVPDRCLVATGGMVIVQPARNTDVPIDRSRWRVDRNHVNLRTDEHYQYVTYKDRVTRDRQTLRMPLGEPKMRTTILADTKTRDQVFAGYFFIANGHWVPSPDQVKLFAFDLTTEYSYYAKIEFDISAHEKSEAELIAIVAELADELLPELMRCLPDWAEIEAQSAEVS